MCTLKFKYFECWRGTREQLEAHGIQLTGPWPYQPGGKEHWARARDSRDYKTSIKRCSTVWPSLYEARINIPSEVWSPKPEQKPAEGEADLARRNLASMHDTADDFRADLVASMREYLGSIVRGAAKPATWHGYTLDEDAVGEIQASFDAVVEAIVGAEIRFDAPRHAEIAQKYRAQIASTDKAFQDKFATLVHPNPRILEGGAQ
jgi:hypothetical protein